MPEDVCPMCRRPMPEAKPTGRPRVWCSYACRKAAAGRTPAEVEQYRQYTAELNARMTAAYRGER